MLRNVLFNNFSFSRLKKILALKTMSLRKKITASHVIWISIVNELYVELKVF